MNSGVAKSPYLGWHQPPKTEYSLPIPSHPLNLIYGRHIESELGIDVITILERICGKRGRCNFLITDYNQAYYKIVHLQSTEEVLKSGVTK